MSAHSIQLSDSVEVPLTKQIIRKKVWDFIEANNLANFPRPVYNRIPNFKGAAKAGSKVGELEEFKKAGTIKVNPDKPQEEVRYQVLSHRKTLLVPTPRLRQGLFNKLLNNENFPKQHLKKLASRQGIDVHSVPIPLDTKLNINVVVIGSVAVDRLGHRIGKGEGFADLEFALATECHQHAMSDNTVVITTVHECQVFAKLPQSLFTQHDVPVDIIVTPSEIIRVASPLTKPKGIIWNMLTNEKMRQVKLLQDVRKKHQHLGVDVTLRD